MNWILRLKSERSGCFAKFLQLFRTAGTKIHYFVLVYFSLSYTLIMYMRNVEEFILTVHTRRTPAIIIMGNAPKQHIFIFKRQSPQ